MIEQTTCPCPHCGQRLTVNVANGPQQVVCPSCSHRILLGLSEPPPPEPSMAAAEVFDDLPQPIVVSEEEVARPAQSKRFVQRAARRAARHANRDLIRSQRIRIAKYSALTIVAVSVLALAGQWAYSLVREVPKDTWATVIPGMQSPDKLLREYDSICELFQQVADSITSRGSRDRAIPQLLVIAARYRGFPSRVASAGLPTDLQLETLEPSFNEHIDVEAKKVKATIDRLRKRSLVLSGDLLAALGEVSTSIDDAAGAMKIAWREIPAAKHDVQRLEREITLIHAELWYAVTAVDDDLAYTKLATDFVVAASELNEIRAELRKGTIKLDDSSYFLTLTELYLDDIDTRLSMLQERFGPIPSPSALKRFRDASYAATRGHFADS